MGNIDGDGKDLMGRRRKESRGQFALVLDLAKASERVCLPVVWGVGNALQFPQEDCGYCLVTSSTRGEKSLKDVCQSLSRPLRPSCQGRSGVVCVYVLYCRMR